MVGSTFKRSIFKEATCIYFQGEHLFSEYLLSRRRVYIPQALLALWGSGGFSKGPVRADPGLFQQRADYFLSHRLVNSDPYPSTYYTKQEVMAGNVKKTNKYFSVLFCSSPASCLPGLSGKASQPRDASRHHPRHLPPGQITVWGLALRTYKSAPEEQKRARVRTNSISG